VKDSGAPELRVIPALSQEAISNFIHHLHICNQNIRPKAHPSAKRSLSKLLIFTKRSENYIEIIGDAIFISEYSVYVSLYKQGTYPKAHPSAKRSLA
jgi:hypothetical protein